MRHEVSYDAYGGREDVRIAAPSGTFRLAQADGVWWLVTPEGNGFLSKGVNTIRGAFSEPVEQGWEAFDAEVRRKHGHVDAWAEAVTERLKAWGFNTVGSWCHPVMRRQRLPYTINLDLAAHAGADWVSGSIPDIFSDAFSSSVQATCRKACAPSDSYLIGYFTDNELAWHRDGRRKRSLLEEYLELPEDAAGRLRATAFLEGRGGLEKAADPELQEAFLEEIARHYFRVCHDAIRSIDPDHLILGCRYPERPPKPLLMGMSGLVDILCINSYEHSAPVDRLRGFHKACGLPVMLTEFSFKAMDSGLPNSKGGGRPVQTQRDRADGFERFVCGLMQERFTVGYHWFQYVDQPKEGRFDGEDCNYGLVTMTDEPWTLLTERMTDVNRRIETLHKEGKAL